jgi:hypothetical protein
LSKFWGNPRLTLPEWRKARHVSRNTILDSLREITVVGRAKVRVEGVVLQDMPRYSLIGFIDSVHRKLRENTKICIVALLRWGHCIIL